MACVFRQMAADPPVPGCQGMPQEARTPPDQGGVGCCPLLAGR